MPITFTTPGQIDETALTVLGINAKDGDSPIGFFGTGLKYAIAISLRLNTTLTITVADADGTPTQYRFLTESATVRNKSFDVIVMRRKVGDAAPTQLRLGFTTELGKTWEPWMAYRELYSNTVDEQGTTAMETPGAAQQPNTTVIRLAGAVFDEVHINRHKWFHNRSAAKLLHSDSDSGINIYAGASDAIFYRGIKVQDLASCHSTMTYDFDSGVALTEDRTALDAWTLHYRISRTILNSNNADLIRTFVLAPENSMEYSSPTTTPSTASPTFVATCADLIRRGKLLRPNIMRLYKQLREPEAPVPMALTRLESAMLRRATTSLTHFGIPADIKLNCVEDLGTDVLGQVKDKQIFIARRAFASGTKMLAGTIFEEHVHQQRGYADMTRAMQNYLIDTIMSLLEELRGDPI